MKKKREPRIAERKILCENRNEILNEERSFYLTSKEKCSKLRKATKMSSRIEYRFRCKKKPSHVLINDQSIPLPRLRELIMKQEHLEQKKDVTLIIMNAQTQKIYKDPTEFIHRNTPVIVSRLPTAVFEKMQTQSGPEVDIQVPEIAVQTIPAIQATQTKNEIAKEQQLFFFGKSGFPRSFAFRPTTGHVVLPYGEVACYQRTDEPPLSENRWSLDDLRRWLCPICHRLLKTATKTNCCDSSFCDSCITEELLKEDQPKGPECPECHAPLTYSSLQEQTQLRAEIKEWQKYDPDKLKGCEEYERMARNKKDKEFGSDNEMSDIAPQNFDNSDDNSDMNENFHQHNHGYRNQFNNGRNQNYNSNNYNQNYGNYNQNYHINQRNNQNYNGNEFNNDHNQSYYSQNSDRKQSRDDYRKQSYQTDRRDQDDSYSDDKKSSYSKSGKPEIRDERRSSSREEKRTEINDGRRNDDGYSSRHNREKYRDDNDRDDKRRSRERDSSREKERYRERSRDKDREKEKDYDRGRDRSGEKTIINDDRKSDKFSRRKEEEKRRRDDERRKDRSKDWDRRDRSDRHDYSRYDRRK